MNSHNRVIGYDMDKESEMGNDIWSSADWRNI
jgi:hypothetical protein